MDHPTAAMQLLSRLRIKHLRLVDALARTQSLRQAATALNVSQPAATKILQDLEDVLGMQLFSRSAQAVRINPMGEFVARYARRMLRETVQFGEDLQLQQQGGAGTLAVGAIIAAHTWLLPRAIAELKATRPLMTIRLMESSSDRLLADLEKNELDLVVGRFTQQSHRPLFDFVPLADEALCVFARAGHPCANVASLADASHQAWVLPLGPTPIRALLEAAFADAGQRLPTNVVETTSIFATLNLVKHADMLAVLPRAAVLAQGRQVSILPITLGHVLSPYGIMTRRDPELVLGVQELKGLLVRMSQGRQGP